jgi:hypothetical protein
MMPIHTLLSRLKELEEKATPDWNHKGRGVVSAGPLREFTRGSSQLQIACFMGNEFVEMDEKNANANLAVESRTALPSLLKLLEQAVELAEHVSTHVGCDAKLQATLFLEKANRIAGELEK